MFVLYTVFFIIILINTNWHNYVSISETKKEKPSVLSPYRWKIGLVYFTFVKRRFRQFYFTRVNILQYFVHRTGMLLKTSQVPYTWGQISSTTTCSGDKCSLKWKTWNLPAFVSSKAFQWLLFLYFGHFFFFFVKYWYVSLSNRITLC